MAVTQCKTLDEYLALDYPFVATADPDGGYVVSFPDLPGCFTQVENIADLPEAVEEVRSLWLETAYDQGIDIPLPSFPEECSGRILLRVPKSLHRRLLDHASQDGISLNQYAMGLLVQGDALARVERRLDSLETGVRQVQDRLQQHELDAPQRPRASLR
jgi:predicted RNase H-like HicB family nuclease